MPARAACIAALSAALALAVPAVGQDKPAYDVSFAYPTGEHLLRYDIVQKNRAGTTSSADMSITTRMDIPLDIAVGEPDSARKVAMTVRRITATVVAGEMHRIVDTDKPETLMAGLPLDVLCQVPFNARIAPDGQITEFTGVAKFVDKAGMGADDPDARAQAVKAVGSGLRQLLVEPVVYLPDEPVAVGDKWKVDRKVYGLPIMGAQKVHAEKLTCTLAKVRKTDAGRVARVEIEGTTELLSGGTATDPKKLTKTGHAEYDLDSGELVTHHVELSGEKTVPMGDEEVTFSVRTTIDAQLDPPAEDETPGEGDEPQGETESE
ncbi:MAG: DUF6263 family protein [Phycisphaerae bacterium]